AANSIQPVESRCQSAKSAVETPTGGEARARLNSFSITRCSASTKGSGRSTTALRIEKAAPAEPTLKASVSTIASDDIASCRAKRIACIRLPMVVLMAKRTDKKRGASAGIVIQESPDLDDG